MRKWNYLIRFAPLYIASGCILLMATVFASKTVTTIAESIPIQRKYTIVIDAGHGGEDGGATSCTGAHESQINLQVALRLRDLCHLLGWKTVMIRTEDISVYTEGTTIAQKKISDLKQRVAITQQVSNAILVSIHQNIFSDSRYHGPQVFYAPTEGSQELAELLQASLREALDKDSNRACKIADSVYLMQHVTCPAVLIECGFLSNPEEEAKLRREDYQKQLVCVMVSALSHYINA